MNTDNWNECVNMNVMLVRNMYSPKLRLGLSWSMPMAHGYSLRCIEECHLGTTGWRSPPDSTDKQNNDEDHIVAPALVCLNGLGQNEVRA